MCEKLLTVVEEPVLLSEGASLLVGVGRPVLSADDGAGGRKSVDANVGDGPTGR